MSRSPRARQADVAERIRLFAEHHIVAVRTQRRTGEIVAVNHAVWGWISPKQYYLMQEIHRVLPDLVSKTIEGGYRLKEAIWSWQIEFEVFATGVKLPAGLAIVAGTLALAAIDSANGNPIEAAFDLASLALPFGELWLLYRGILGAADITRTVDTAVSDWASAAGHNVDQALKAAHDYFAALFGFGGSASGESGGGGGAG